MEIGGASNQRVEDKMSMDLSLDESQQILVGTFSEMLEKECTTTHVREREDTGFFAELWDRYCSLGANVMGLPEEAGGLDMSLLELGLVATQSGRALAPVPFVEVAVAGRLLARVSQGDALLGAIAEGQPAASLAIPRPNAILGTRCSVGSRKVVPFGSIVDAVLVLENDTLFAVESADARDSVRLRDLGSGALAHWGVESSASPRVLASGGAATKAMTA